MSRHDEFDRRSFLKTAGAGLAVSLEYESGPWDGVEGSKYLFKEVMAALSSV